jgi:uncharacterized protein YkwD
LVRRLLPTSLSFVVLCLVAAAPAASAARCRDARALPGSISANRHARAVRCLVNQQRRAHGMRLVRSNGRLVLAALGHARDMVGGRFFGHVGRNGSTLGDRIAFFGYGGGRPFAAGETLGYGYGGRGTPRGIVGGWLRSGPHRHILLGRRWRDVGIAVVVRDGVAMVAADFGRR